MPKACAMRTAKFLFSLPLVLALAAPASTPVSAEAAPPAGQGASGTRPEWAWPLPPVPPVLRRFEPPDKPWLSGHRGVDLQAAYDAGPVTSPADGTVSFVGTVVDRPVITVDHGGGIRSSFEPVKSELKEGALVSKGQVIGTLENGHCEDIPCLHWGVRRGEDYVNPLAFVTDLRPSVLLPLNQPAFNEPGPADGK